MIHKISEEDGKKAVIFSRKMIESKLSLIQPEEIPEFPDSFKKEGGAFVTIKKEGELRGCMGRPLPNQSLEEAIKEAATSAAFKDPRFSAVNKNEIEDLNIEVTLLGPLEKIEYDRPHELKESIEIGKHGLLVERNGRSGLLLPQVAVDQEWDSTDFLSQVCMKAGLRPDAWFDENLDFYRFGGRIFMETDPNKKIVEKKLRS